MEFFEVFDFAQGVERQAVRISCQLDLFDGDFPARGFLVALVNDGIGTFTKFLIWETNKTLVKSSLKRK